VSLLIRCAGILCLSALVSLAQVTARISGQIQDSSVAVVPGAKVTAESAGTGVTNATNSDSQGRYVFAALPIGVYRVSVAATGFQNQIKSGVELTVASSVTVDFALQVGQISDVVEVTTESSLIDTAAANGAYKSTRQLLDLPINGRDYARFTLLTPGAVARSNFISDITINGMHSVHNSFSIDGIDASRVDQPYMANGYERGARLLTGSLETMSEFRVQTSNYRAEYGRSSGSSITIVSKSGTNELHGSIFEFSRNDFFDARNFFNTKPSTMAPFRYNNFGGNLGGAIVKDKTFFFANYEGSRQRVGITGSGTVPSALMRSRVLATSPELAPILNQFPTGQSPTTNSLVDNYTTSAVSPVREDTGSIRVDHNFSSSDRIYTRFNLNDTETSGPLFGVTPAALGLTDFQSVPVTTTNGVVNYTHIFTPAVIFESYAGIQRWGSQINSETQYPQTSINGLIVAPGSRNFTRTNSTMLQYSGALSWVRGAHTIKLGSTVFRSGVNVLSHNLVTLTYTSIEDFINNRLNQAAVTAGNPGTGRRQTHAGSYVQDTWQVRPGLTIDLGLRYDIATPNHGEADRYRVFDTRILDLGPAGGDWFQMNKTNFAPRFAIGWQPFRKLAVRSGYGIFYQQYPPGQGYNVALNTLTGNTTLLRAQIPDLRYPLDPYLSSGATPLTSVEGFNWNKPDMYAQQWNFTLNFELNKATAMTAAYIGNRGINLMRGRNINFFDPSLGRRPLTQFANVTVNYNDGQSTYHAFQFNLTKRYSHGLQGAFNYTFGKVLDNTQDYGSFSNQVQDNRCTGNCERGLGSSDIRHNASLEMLYELPFGKGQRFLNSTSGFGQAVAGGWQLSALGLMRTGAPAMVSLGVNTFGNANLTNQRPNAVAGAAIYPANQTIDNWLNASAYTLPASGSFGNLARNAVRGPGFQQFDLSLTKQMPVTERVKLKFRAEIYNALNRPNFAQPNTTWNTINFGRIFNTLGRTLGYGTSRQIQLSLRLQF
jgi:hypothetical protein